jgi:hyperosmotically inducible protein
MKRMMIRSTTVLVPLALLALGGPLWAGEARDADDTGRNVRDRDAGSPTAGRQSNDSEDVRITREIRKAVVADDSLSTNAHNVKIVTIDGVVTLRGPVNSSAERTKVAAKAEQVAGVKRVDDQLEITARK